MGVPGRETSSLTSLAEAHRSRSREMNLRPLPTLIVLGRPIPPGAFERLHNIFATTVDAWIGRRAKAGMRVDDGQKAQLPARGELP